MTIICECAWKATFIKTKHTHTHKESDYKEVIWHAVSANSRKELKKVFSNKSMSSQASLRVSEGHSQYLL
jgi:hypothetical protein